MRKKWVRTILVVTIILVCILIVNHTNRDTNTKMVELPDHVTMQMPENLDGLSYSEYLAQHDTNRPTDQYIINADEFTKIEGMEEVLYQDYEGMPGTSVYTADDGSIEYQVDIKTAGLYELSFQYYPVEGKRSNIQRKILIDGEVPYRDLNLFELARVWVNHSDVWEEDNRGNDLKPLQVEAPQWMSEYVYSVNGYSSDKLSCYLTTGKHTITIESIREPLVIRSITLGNLKSTESYQTVKEQWDAQGIKDSTGVLVQLEGEKANRKSSQMLYPMQDTSSPAVTPYDAKLLKNNVIGGNSWRTVGDWLEWDFEVEQSGYYYISLHDRQNLVKGIYVSREITLDGQSICQELNEYGFTYSAAWRLETLSDADKKPYRIYIEAGKHTLRMKAVLGNFSQIISQVQDSVVQLNAIYREIIRITGTSPDPWRDYQIEASIPEIEEQLSQVYQILDLSIAQLRVEAGRGSDRETALQTMKVQLADLITDVEQIPKQLASFKTNLRAVGNWLTSVVEQPLAIDTIYVYSPDVTVHIKNNKWYNRAMHEMKKLYYSFVIDYNQIGNVSTEDEEQKEITMWIGTGRDQANIVKKMIDDFFTPEHGITVNVELVDMNTLLKATLAGSGPDVAIQVFSNSGASGANVPMGNELPVNYGIRNAVMDLSQFKDFDEVCERFYDASLTQYEFNGACYALPETISFPVMYYRKDILSELGVSVPKTWDEMKVVMSVLNNNQMELGMLPKEEVFAMLLYQNGGEYYNEDASRTLLDSDASVNAFKKYCELYSDYRLDVSTSELERFRTGECPIIVNNIGTYNVLQVSAPDIKGLWGIAPVPGTVQADGSLDITVPCSGTAAIIMEQSKNKDASWEFLKWWTRADIQNQFSNEMESLMGQAARVSTANKEAFRMLSWNKDDLESLNMQLDAVRGIPQIPGGYITWRNVNNAYFSVIADSTGDVKASPKEELVDKVILINEEINFKRREFDLPIYGEEE